MNKRKPNKSLSVSDKLVASCVKLVEKVSKPFAGAVRLTPDDRRRVLKPRKGAPLVIPTLRSLVLTNGLESGSASLDEVSSKLAYAARLERLFAPVDALRNALRDEILVARSDAWRGLTDTYAMLRGAARTNESIAKELEQVESTFRTRSKKAAKAEAPAAKPAAPATEAPATSGTR